MAALSVPVLPPLAAWQLSQAYVVIGFQFLVEADVVVHIREGWVGGDLVTCQYNLTT